MDEEMMRKLVSQRRGERVVPRVLVWMSERVCARKK